MGTHSYNNELKNERLASIPIRNSTVNILNKIYPSTTIIGDNSINIIINKQP